MPSTLDDFDVIGTIGSGSYGTCKKIRRKKDGKVKISSIIRNFDIIYKIELNMHRLRER